MNERRPEYVVAASMDTGNPLHEPQNRDNLPSSGNEFVMVSRRELEFEYRTLMQRVQQIRKLLGLGPLMTGKQARRGKDR